MCDKEALASLSHFIKPKGGEYAIIIYNVKRF